MKYALGLVSAFMLLAPATAQSEEPAAPSLKRLDVSSDDVIRATGLNIYKFEVSLPKDTKFAVILREWGNEEKPPRVIHQFKFQKNTEGTSTLRVSFLARERGIRGVLLAGDVDADYRIDVTGCDRTGMSTIVALPLVGIKQRTLFVHPLEDDEKPKPGEILLLTVAASEEGKPAPYPPSAAFPRGELLIQTQN